MENTINTEVGLSGVQLPYDTKAFLDKLFQSARGHYEKGDKDKGDEVLSVGQDVLMYIKQIQLRMELELSMKEK